MSQSVKSAILEEMRETLMMMRIENGYNFEPVSVTRVNRPVAECTIFPSVEIWNPSSTPTGTDNVGLDDVQHWTMRVVVRYHIRKDASLDQAESDILKAILEVPSRKNLAHYTDVAGATLFDTENQYIDVQFDVRFSHQRTDPTVRA